MRIVVALGGNALLKRGEPLTAQNQRENVKVAARALAPLAREHSLIITHGNGPQVGLLALEAAAVHRRRAVHARRAQRRVGGHDRLHDRAGTGQRPARGRPVRHHPHPGGGRPGRPGLPEPQQAHRASVRPGGGRAAGPRARLDRRSRQRQVPPAGGVAPAAAHLRDCEWWSGWWSAEWWSSAPVEAASRPCSPPTACSWGWRRSSTRTTPGPCWPARSRRRSSSCSPTPRRSGRTGARERARAIRRASPDALEKLQLRRRVDGPQGGGGLRLRPGDRGTGGHRRAWRTRWPSSQGRAGTLVSTEFEGIEYWPSLFHQSE